MKNNRGSTLIELMVAIIIFTIILLYGMSFFTYGHRFQVKAQESEFALQYAKDYIENNCRAKTYDQVPSYEATSTSDGGITYYLVNNTLETATTTYNEKYKTMNVDVTWTNNGFARSLSLHTIKSQQ